MSNLNSKFSRISFLSSSYNFFNFSVNSRQLISNFNLSASLSCFFLEINTDNA